MEKHGAVIGLFILGLGDLLFSPASTASSPAGRFGPETAIYSR